VQNSHYELEEVKRTNNKSRELLETTLKGKRIIDLIASTSGNKKLLNKTSDLAVEAVDVNLDGGLGIQLLVWFLVSSITESSNGVSPAISKHLKYALQDMSSLIGSKNGHWCQVRYPIRAIHGIHDAFAGLVDTVLSQRDDIDKLKDELRRKKEAFEAEKTKMLEQYKQYSYLSKSEHNKDRNQSTSIGLIDVRNELSSYSSRVKPKTTPDKERAIALLRDLLGTRSIIRYSPEETKSKSKRNGALTECGPEFYVSRVIRPKLDKYGFGHMADDLSIYRSVMPELYNPLRVYRYRKAQELNTSRVAVMSPELKTSSHK
jgi:hypothetical protein